MVEMWNFTKLKVKPLDLAGRNPATVKHTVQYALVIFIVLGSISVLMCRFKAKQISFFENSSHLNANIHRSLFMPSESAFIFCAIFCDLACYFAAAVAVCPSV